MRYVVDGFHRLACQPVEHCQIIGTLKDASHGAAPVGIGIAYHVAFCVHCSVGGAAYHLRLAVEVEVIYHELSVVRSGAYVSSEVYAPQPFAAETVAIEILVAGIAVVSVVMGV